MQVDHHSQAERADQRYLRWNERTLQQLGFLNNVLIGLGAGVVGLALAHVASTGTSIIGGWRGILVGSALINVALSVGLGLLVACVRLRSIRMAASRNRVKYFWADIQGNLGAKDDSRRSDLKRYYLRWMRWSKYSRTLKSKRLRSATESCLVSLEVGSGLPSVQDKNDVDEAAQIWEQGLDDCTWRLLWGEFALFGFGATLLAVIPISVYL